MTDEQLDRLEGEARLRYAESVDGDGPPDARINVSAYVLCDLLADNRRLRELERACRMARIIPGGLKGHYYAHEQAGLDAIGRLLEGER